MSLISLLVGLIIIGLLLYLVEAVLPIDPKVKLIIRVVVLIAIVLWIAQLFLGDAVLPRLR